MRSGMMKKSEEDWDYYSGLPSPMAYEKRKVEKKMEEELEDGVDIFSVYRKKKTTYSESLEDEE
jgi:hypothetical protein